MRGDPYQHCADGRRFVKVTLAKDLCGAVWADMSVMDDNPETRNFEVATVTNENTERERLLTPHQVAELFRVDPKTVARWASNGWIGSIRTPGGHRRFRESEVRSLLAERAMLAASPPA